MNVRSLLGIALVALLIPAAASAAPRGSTAAAPVSSSGLTVGGFIGYETNDLSGVTLRADVDVPFQALAPQVYLSWVGSVGFSHLTRSESAFGIGVDSTENILKLIPAARFSIPLSPQFTVYGDAGIGLYYGSLTLKTSDPFFGTVEVSDSTVSVMMRFAAGAWFTVSPQVRLGASLELDPYFGKFDQNTWTFQAGAMFKM